MMSKEVKERWSVRIGQLQGLDWPEFNADPYSGPPKLLQLVPQSIWTPRLPLILNESSPSVAMAVRPATATVAIVESCRTSKRSMVERPRIKPSSGATN